MDDRTEEMKEARQAGLSRLEAASDPRSGLSMMHAAS
jgi:hypothetical protein